MTDNRGCLEKAGGQAVIEGVMMRSSKRAAVAVRAPDGSIVARVLRGGTLSDRSPVWRKPFLRGSATLVDTLRLGISALNWSADVASPPDPGTRRMEKAVSGFVATAFTIIVTVGIFGWMPLRLALLVLPGGRENLAINLLAGLVRMAAFIGYVVVISRIPSIRRIFTYHGAEHQTIHAWERGSDDLVDAALAESPRHPRCGTSFLLLLMLLSVAFYTLVDTAVGYATGSALPAHWRTLYHLPLIPVVMGISYEVLRLVDRRMDDSPLARAMAWPGLALQRLTTGRAGRREVEVAVAALKVAIGEDPGGSVRLEGSDG